MIISLTPTTILFRLRTSLLITYLQGPPTLAQGLVSWVVLKPIGVLRLRFRV